MELQELILKNNVSEVSALAEWVEQLGMELSLPMPDVFQLNLALEEAVVNVISYAYPGKEDMPLSLSVEKDAQTGNLIFRLKDNGVPFDPTKAEAPDVTLSAEERQIGGLGIFLVQKIMKQVEYQRQGDSNVLTMEYAVTGND